MPTMIDKLNDILDEKQSKIIPENIKSGVTVFGVNGELTPSISGAKIFNTINDMNNDQNKNPNDKAIVFNSLQSRWQEQTSSKLLIFPSSITLEEVLSGYIRCSLRGYDESTGANADVSMQISNSKCNIRIYTSGEMISIDYSSSDGLTYIKNSGPDNIILDCEVSFDTGMGEEFDSRSGYFINYMDNYFYGLYECKNDEIIHKNHIINLIKLNTINYDSQTGINAEKGTKQVTENEINTILNKTKFYSENYKTCSIFYINGKYYIMPFYHDESFYMFLIYSNVTKKVSLVCSRGNVYDYTKDPSEIFIYDPVNDSVEYKTTANYNTSAGSWGAGPYNLYLITEVNTTDNDYGLFYYSDKHVLKNVSMLYCLSNEYPTERDWSSFSIDDEYYKTYENNYHKINYNIIDD